MNKKVIELSDEDSHWITTRAIFPEAFELKKPDGVGIFTYNILDRDDHGKVRAVASRCGHKGFVLKVQDPETDILYAAKFCVREDYLIRSPKEEAKLGAKLAAAGDLFVFPTNWGVARRFSGMPHADDDFVCFISHWVEGRTLKQYLEDEESIITPEFVCRIATEMLRAVQFLGSIDLKHDDLHTGNIMLSKRPEGLALSQDDAESLKISIIDLGSLKPNDQETRKSRNDFLNVIETLVSLYNQLWSNRRLASTHPEFLRKYCELIEKAIDPDPLRHLLDEKQIATELAHLKADLYRPASSQPERQFAPFDAISAEHLADDSTLLSLFVNFLPWMALVQDNKPVVFTGPRGCGKSMLFRFLAARTHIGVKPKALADEGAEKSIASFGVYISCSTHLQNNLSWIARKEGRAANFAHQISTFFQLVVVRELLTSLGEAYADKNAREQYRLTQPAFDELIAFIDSYFDEPIETPRLFGVERIFHFAEDLDRLRRKLNRSLLLEKEPPAKLPDTFLGDVTSKLVQLLPPFKASPLVFLLDDYSSSRVQPEIQSITNKIIFERRSSHYFKISCEKFGFESRDIDGVGIEEAREYVTVDAGAIAISDIQDSVSREFISNLIDQRLETANWKGRCSTLIGNSSPFNPDTKLAKEIRDAAGNKGAHHFYFGIDHIARLWSGDTATILQIIKGMFSLGGVDANSQTLIAKKTQHDAITNVSKAFKERISGYHPNGPAMANILNHYASAAREILVNGALDSSGDPRRLYRIEMTKPSPKSFEQLLLEEDETTDKTAARIAKDLLRRAIFIELSDSRGKEGPSTHTMRWELRKMFLPAFGLSLNRDSYFDVKGVGKLIEFLMQPEKFGLEMRSKYQSKEVDNLNTTRSLFGEDSNAER
jgi:hypothetical protein